MKKNYIYLDWNVIQYIKHECKNGKEFKELMKRLSKKYVFPWAEGHLQDLLVSLNQNNLDYVEEDLIFLNEISNGYVLALVNGKTLIPLKNFKDIKVFFNELKTKSEIEKEQELVLNFETNNSFEIDMNQVKDNNLFKPFLEQNNGVLDNKVFSEFILHKWENIDNPQYYKKFRLAVESLKKQFENTPNSVISQESKYFDELQPFLNFILEDDLELLKKDFNKVVISFLAIDKKRKFEELTIADKIQLIYALLDYNPHFRDKINKKNRPSNMNRDINNLFFASQAKYYVTEDAMTYKKSKFVCEVLKLKVKVLKMDEFIAIFS